MPEHRLRKTREAYIRPAPSVTEMAELESKILLALRVQNGLPTTLPWPKDDDDASQE